MKKIIILLLIVVLAASVFVGCESNEKTKKTEETENIEKTTEKTGKTDKKVNTVKVIDIKLTDEEYAFGVDKKQPELLASVNAFIAEIQANGTFDEICNKYFGDGTPSPVSSAVLDTSKDQLVVATNAAFEPFEYMQGELLWNRHGDCGSSSRLSWC